MEASPAQVPPVSEQAAKALVASRKRSQAAKQALDQAKAKDQQQAATEYVNAHMQHAAIVAKAQAERFGMPTDWDIPLEAHGQGPTVGQPPPGPA